MKVYKLVSLDLGYNERTDIEVPYDTKWVAIDLSGYIYAYKEKPNSGFSSWVANNPHCVKCIGKKMSNWWECLYEIFDEPEVVEPEPHKSMVNYVTVEIDFGNSTFMDVEVPVDTKWIGVDLSGKINGFTCKPHLSRLFSGAWHVFVHDHATKTTLGQVNEVTNWKECLYEVFIESEVVEPEPRVVIVDKSNRGVPNRSKVSLEIGTSVGITNLDISVRNDTRWVAIDKDGYVYSYNETTQPQINTQYEHWVGLTEHYVTSIWGSPWVEGFDWKECLYEITWE